MTTQPIPSTGPRPRTEAGKRLVVEAKWEPSGKPAHLSDDDYRWLAESVLDAARSRPATDPAGLDVERLARALVAVGWPYIVSKARENEPDWIARRLAAEYARLSVADGPGPEERLEVEPGHNHTTTGLPTYPVCRAACPLGCDKALAPTEQIEVRPGEFLPRPRMVVVDPIAEGEAGLAVRRAAASPYTERRTGR